MRARGYEFIQTTNPGSWLRLRCAGRRLSLRGSGLPLLTALALTVLGLPVLRAPAAFLARREIGGRRLLVLADDDLGAVGQVGKAGRHHAIGGGQSAPSPRIPLFLSRYHN